MYNCKLISFRRKILISDHCEISAFFELIAAYVSCQFLMQLICCITCSVISGSLGWCLYTDKQFERNTKCVNLAHRIIKCTEMKLKHLQS